MYDEIMKSFIKCCICIPLLCSPCSKVEQLSNMLQGKQKHWAFVDPSVYQSGIVRALYSSCQIFVKLYYKCRFI